MSSVTDSAKSQLIQLVDTPFTAQYSSFGTAMVNWAGTIGPTVSVSGYRQAYVLVVGTSITKSFDFNMGKISGATAAQTLNQPADGKIHAFDIQGPEISIVLRGTAGATDHVQLWLYLRS
jgi:hypothetical protein